MSLLPGWFPGAKASGPPPTSVSFFGSAADNQPSVTAPASIIDGDLMVLWQMATGTPSPVTPAGFTNLLTQGSGTKYMIDVKRANGTEGGASITGMDGTVDRKILLVFRGNTPANGFVFSTPTFELNATGDPSAQNVLAAGQPAPLVVFGLYGSASGNIDPRTMSPTKDAEVALSTTMYAAYKIYNASPADVSIDMEDEGTNNTLAGLYARFV